VATALCLFAVVLSTAGAGTEQSAGNASLDSVEARVNAAGFSAVRAYSSEPGGSLGVALAPVAYWELLARLLLLTPTNAADSQLQRWSRGVPLAPDQPETQTASQVSYLYKLLGYSPSASLPDVLGALRVLQGVGAVDGWSTASALWYQKDRTRFISTDEATFRELGVTPTVLNFDTSVARDYIDAWSDSKSDGLLPSLIDPLGQLEPQFANSLSAQILRFNTNLSPKSGFVTVGSGYYPTASGLATQVPRAQYLRYWDPNSRVIGVALPSSDRRVTAYVFTARSADSIRRLFMSLDQASWKKITAQFRPAYGDVMAAVSLDTRVILDFASIGHAVVTRLGAAPFAPVLRSAIDLRGSRLALASAAIISTTQPPCCFDYTKAILQPFAFRLNASPVGVVIVDNSGLILFLGYSTGGEALDGHPQGNEP
jgi:hypothetical protein